MTFEEFIEFKDNNNFQTFNMIDDGVSNLSFFIFKNQLYSIVFPSRYNSFRFGFRIYKIRIIKNKIIFKRVLTIIKNGNQYINETQMDLDRKYINFLKNLITKEKEKEIIDKYF
jgi:hypothetical protein